jgi:hypothetical protein
MSKGYKLNTTSPSGIETLMTDDQVLECRRRYEYENWTKKQLMAEYNMDGEYMRKLLDYATRSKLIPRKKA